MDKILIMDNFLNECDLKTLLEIINIKKYTADHNSGYRELIITSFFSVFNTEDFFVVHLKKIIEEKLNRKFILNRHYMHVQTFGLDGGYHTDDNGDDKFTFCLYITQLNNDEIEEAGGDFLIKIPNTDTILSIDTFSNRGLFFPSTYFHKGLAYSKNYSEMRLCITWKFKEIAQNNI
jgi:hypothetical protein